VIVSPFTLTFPPFNSAVPSESKAEAASISFVQNPIVLTYKTDLCVKKLEKPSFQYA